MSRSGPYLAWSQKPTSILSAASIFSISVMMSYVEEVVAELVVRSFVSSAHVAVLRRRR